MVGIELTFYLSSSSVIGVNNYSKEKKYVYLE